MRKYLVSFILLVLCINTSTYADSLKPYFCSTKFDYVSVREEPKFNSVVKYTYTQKNEPVKVIGSFCNWRKIIDIDSHVGWVYIGHLSTKKYVIIKQPEKYLYDSFDNLQVMAHLKKGIRCRLLLYNIHWCKVRVGKYTGWITKIGTWGTE